jgi:hypothetical protein
MIEINSNISEEISCASKVFVEFVVEDDCGNQIRAKDVK